VKTLLGETREAARGLRSNLLTRPLPQRPVDEDRLANADDIASAHELVGDEEDEAQVGRGVAAGEATRLLPESEEPLEAQALPEDRRAATSAGDDIDRSADPHDEWRTDVPAVSGDELLLAGRADRNENELRFRLSDRFGYGALVDGLEVAISAADDSQARMAVADTLHGCLQDVGPGAEDVHAPPTLLGTTEERLHQVDAGDPLGHRVVEQAGRPHDGLAIGSDELGAIDDLSQSVVVLERHELCGVDRDVAAVRSRPDRRCDAVERVIHGHPIEFALEDARPSRWPGHRVGDKR
jgi:hypothetical protein